MKNAVVGYSKPTMDLVTLAVFFFVFAVGMYLLKCNKNLPPGPVGIPLFGSVSLFRKFSRQRPYLTFFEEAKKYGNIMSFWLGQQLVVVLNGYDVIHEALVKNADVFNTRASHILSIARAKRTGNGILLNDYGPEWRFLRKFTLQALRDFGVGKSSIEEKIMVEIEETTKHLDESNGQPVDIDLLMQNAIGNVIYGINFGLRYNFDDPQFAAIREMMSNLVRSTGILDAFNFLPSICAKIMSRKDNEVRQKRLESGLKIRAFITEQIEEHSRTFDPDNIRDFVDLYLKTVKENKEDEQRYLKKDNIFRVILDLFLAGSESTSTTLNWAFLYMAVYPDVQEKCQQEIDKEFGGKIVTWSGRGQLPYATSTLMEIQRVASIAPLAVAHCTLRDTTLGGYTIPEKTIVLPSLYSAAMDTKYWDKPKTFNPDRFIGDDGKLVKNEAWVPFSVGPRVCLGEPLARTELFLVFTNLIQRLRFRCESDHVAPSLHPRIYNVTNAPEPFKLRVNKRQGCAY